MADVLKELLQQYDYTTLLAILTFQGYKTKGRVAKPDVIDLLLGYLTDAKAVAEKVAKLTPAGRAVLAVLQRQGGAASRAAISRYLRSLNLLELLEAHPDTHGISQPNFRNPASRYLEEILANLLAQGLVLGRAAPDRWGRTVAINFRLVSDYLIPPEVLKLLPPPPPLDTSLAVLPAPAVVLESSARVFQRDLYLYWSYVDRNQPELIGKGFLSKRHLTAVNETLLQRETIGTGKGEADFPRLLFLRLILLQLGLLENTGYNLRSRPSEQFFGLEPQQRIRRTLEAYPECRQLNELHEMAAITSISQPLLPIPDSLVSARRAILASLGQVRGWTALQAIIDNMRVMNYEFFMPRTYRGEESPYYFTPRHPYAASTNPMGWDWQLPPGMDESAGWLQVEAKLIAWQILKPLFWMGLVDLGLRKAGAEPDSFQLTAPGRWLLAGGPPLEVPVSGGQVVVQPDFTILAFDPINDVVLYRLEQFAQRISAERAILLRLTQQSVYAGQRAGWSAELIKDYLEELSHQPLPANIARTLVEWQAVHERIHIYPDVDVLHAAPADLDELAGNAKTAPLLARRLSSEVVLLPAKSNLGEVRRLLIAQGWWPLLTPRSAALPERAVSLDAEGRLSFVTARPGLYLRAHLARFADPDGPGYRLTPETVRRAVNAGLTAAQIVSELEKVLDRPMPHEWSHRLLAWSGFFGSVEAEGLTVLRFKNATALAEFRRDPQLAELLPVMDASELKRMVLVRPKDVEKLRRLLSERGVEWKE